MRTLVTDIYLACLLFPTVALAQATSPPPQPQRTNESEQHAPPLLARQPSGGDTGAPDPTDTKPSPETQPKKESHQLTGTYLGTFNAWTFGKWKPSQGHRLTFSYPASFGGTYDARIEYYTDGSFNSDPPGVLRNNINEPKFETQLMYNRRLGKGFGITGGFLYHDNFRFPDEYGWFIIGPTFSAPLGKEVTLSLAALGEQRTWSGRPFYDLSGTLEYRFAPKWNIQASYHYYENLGEFDREPTQKREYEFGINKDIGRRQTIGVSFFRHIQLHGPNDQFSYLKVKYGIAF